MLWQYGAEVLQPSMATCY